MNASPTRWSCLAALAALVAQPAIAQVSVDQSGKLEAGDEQIASGEYVDEYLIEGRAGDLLEVRVYSDDFDTYLMVSGPGGAKFENDDANSSTVNSRILERLPESGSYRIAVTSYEPGETGAYTMHAETSARPANGNLTSREQGELGTGDGRLASGEYTDTFTFEGEAGDLVELDLNSDDFDAYLLLRGPQGANFDNDDVEPGNSNARISATLPESGEYSVMVTTYAPEETGAYLLEVVGAQVTFVPHQSLRDQFGNSGSGARLAVDDPVGGSLAMSDLQTEDGKYYDIYTLEADPGSQLTLRLSSGEIDTYLAAFGSDGFEASNDDDTQAGGTDSRLEVLVPISGTLTIAATSYGSDETGRYSLTAQVSRVGGGPVDVSNSEPIALGDIVEGALTPADGRSDTSFEDSFILQAAAQQEVDVTLSSGDFDTLLRIEGPGGFRAENDDDPRLRTLDSRIRTVLPEAGTYRIVVTSYGAEGLGSYRLVTGLASDTSERRAGEAQVLQLGEKVTGSLALGDETISSGEFADFYQFEGERGQRLTFDMESAEFDTYLSLIFPGGGREANDDRAGLEDTNSRLSITLPEDGIYQLAATSYAPEEVGTYTLSVGLADASVRTIAPTSNGSRVFALTVGVADYERVDTLDLTDRDALKLSQTLSAAGVLAPESVTLLNADATRENFIAAFDTITSAVGPDDLLLVFFSGHGDKVEGVDTEMDGSSETIELFDEALHDYELEEMFANITARTLLVIDACFSGGFDNIIDQRVERMGIFSSDSDVLSLVADKFEAGGYVSLLMRQALEGGADTNGDLAITAGELSEFMRRGFYRIALEVPLDAGGEDFRGEETLGYQHLIVDRGGDGMPYGQVLMHIAAD